MRSLLSGLPRRYCWYALEVEVKGSYPLVAGEEEFTWRLICNNELAMNLPSLPTPRFPEAVWVSLESSVLQGTPTHPLHYSIMTEAKYLCPGESHPMASRCCFELPASVPPVNEPSSRIHGERQNEAGLWSTIRSKVLLLLTGRI